MQLLAVMHQVLHNRGVSSLTARPAVFVCRFVFFYHGSCCGRG